MGGVSSTNTSIGSSWLLVELETCVGKEDWRVSRIEGSQAGGVMSVPTVSTS